MELIKEQALPAIKGIIGSELGVENPPNPIELAAEFAAKYKNVNVADLDDEEGLKTVKSSRLELRRKRIAVQKKGKEYDAVFKVAMGNIGDFVSAIVEPIQAEENRLKEIEDRVKKGRDERQAAKDREEALKFMARTETLIKLGAHFNGDLYSLENATATSDRIQTATDTEWEQIKARFEDAKAEKDRKAEEQRKQAEELEKLKAEKAKLEAELEVLRAAKEKPAPKPIAEPPKVEPKPEPPKAEAATPEPVKPTPVESPKVEERKPKTLPEPEPLNIPIAPKKSEGVVVDEWEKEYGNLNGPGKKHHRNGAKWAAMFVKEHLLEKLGDGKSVKSRGDMVKLVENLIV